MLAVGCPEFGFTEWTMESLYLRPIYAATEYGVCEAVMHENGLLQGPAMSCCVINFMGTLLHKIWKLSPAKYTFSGVSPFPNPVKVALAVLGYVDDNVRWCDSWKGLVESSKLFGHLSIVARTGRNTAKAKIFGYNCINDPTYLDAGSPDHMVSVAWSRTALKGTGAVARSTIPIQHARSQCAMYQYLGVTLAVNPALYDNKAAHKKVVSAGSAWVRGISAHPHLS
jgi:hypothetical protein